MNMNLPPTIFDVNSIPFSDDVAGLLRDQTHTPGGSG